MKPSRIGLLAKSRGYGSAAAVELDYDSEDEYSYYEEEQLNRVRVQPEPMLGVAASAPGRGVQWVLIGEPGVRRHVYAEGLSKILEVPHISMGSLLRQELNPRSSLYKQISNAVNEGKLVREEVIFALLSKRLEEGYCKGETGFILDGIPRTRIQAEILDQIVDVDLVVNFKCTNNHLGRKDLGSETTACQELLTVGNSGFPATVANSACKEKLRIYAEQGKPLEDYYRKQKKLLDFQVGVAPGETWQGLLAALHLQHMNAAGDLQKLTA